MTRSIFRSAVRGRFAVVLLCLLACKPTMASRLFIDPQFDVEVTTNIPYATKLTGRQSGERTLKATLYRPTGANLPDQLPAAIVMGGGYFLDNSTREPEIAREFASRGYVVLDIEYRTAIELPPPPGTPFSAPVERSPAWLLPTLESLAPFGVTLQSYQDTIGAATDDAADAVDWLVDRADIYHINPNWIAAGGFSAGAVIGLMLGADAIDGVDPSVRVNAVFSLQGAMFSLESKIDPGDAAVYIQHGTLDDVVPYSEVPLLIDALQAAGVPYETYIVPGAGHSGASARHWLAQDQERFFTFMADQLTVPEPSTYALMAMSLGALAFARSRRTRRSAVGEASHWSNVRR